jgi:aldehyde:ferredoxin oxidoreductase
VACKKQVEIREGTYAGLGLESVEYEPAWAVGANCGNSDVASVAKMIDQCNDGSDYLPERFLKEPSEGPGSKGQVCELPQMLEEY